MESLRNLGPESGGRLLGTERPSTPAGPGDNADFERRLESVREERGAQKAREEVREGDRRGDSAAGRGEQRRARVTSEDELAGEPEEGLEPELNEDTVLVSAPQILTDARPLPPGSARPAKPEGHTPPGAEPDAAEGPAVPNAEPAAATPAAPTVQTPAPQEAPPTAPKAAGEAVVALQRVDAAGESTVQLERDLSPTRGPVDAGERAQRQIAADVLNQVRVAIRPGMRQAEIHLAPAELGRVSIRLAIRGARVDAVARVESIEALAALERHLPELRAAFADRGLEVGELSLEYSGDPSPDSDRDGPSHGSQPRRSSSGPTESAAEHPRSRPDVTTENAVDTLA